MSHKHTEKFWTRKIGAGKASIVGRASGAVQSVRTLNADMLARDEAARRGTRRRALVPTAVGFALVGVMFSLVSSNVLAVNFTTGNNKFRVYSNYLDAQKAAGFLSPTTQQDGSNDGVMEFGIVTAKLSGLCAIASETIPVINLPYSLKITAGDPVPDTYSGAAVPTGVTTDSAGKLSGASLTGSIAANNLFLNSNMLSGYGNKISGLNLGQSAGTVHTSAGLAWDTSTGGTSPSSLNSQGNFGLYAEQLNIGGLTGDTYGLNLAGAITLPSLKITVEPGTKSQADCS